MTTLEEATTHELVTEFMTRDCKTRNAALRSILDKDDVRDLMSLFDIDEDDGGSSYDYGYEHGKRDGREEGFDEVKEKLLGLVAELAFSINSEAQARVRDHLWREYGITNIHAARLF